MRIVLPANRRRSTNFGVTLVLHQHYINTGSTSRVCWIAYDRDIATHDSNDSIANLLFDKNIQVWLYFVRIHAHLRCTCAR